MIRDVFIGSLNGRTGSFLAKDVTSFQGERQPDNASHHSIIRLHHNDIIMTSSYLAIEHILSVTWTSTLHHMLTQKLSHKTHTHTHTHTHLVLTVVSILRCLSSSPRSSVEQSPQPQQHRTHSVCHLHKHSPSHAYTEALSQNTHTHTPGSHCCLNPALPEFLSQVVRRAEPTAPTTEQACCVFCTPFALKNPRPPNEERGSWMTSCAHSRS